MMMGDKVPSLDGFPVLIFQRCWDVFLDDIIGMMNDFHTNGGVIDVANSTFITLIPKKVGVVDISEFRPIILPNGAYKIVTRCVAERLKPLTCKLIDDFQSTFVQGQQILDGFLVTHKCIKSRLGQN